jgi:hypothetical protein
VRDQELFAGRFGRRRTVVEGPRGCLYALTSNRDGRGVPVASDDRILRIEPPGSRRCSQQLENIACRWLSLCGQQMTPAGVRIWMLGPMSTR